MMLVGRRAADSRCLATIWFVSSRPLGGTWWSTNCALDDVDFGVTVKASTQDRIPPRTPAASGAHSAGPDSLVIWHLRETPMPYAFLAVNCVPQLPSSVPNSNLISSPATLPL